MEIIALILIGALIWAIIVGHRNRDLANRNADVANTNLDVVNHNTTLATVVMLALIDYAGPKKAAKLYYEQLQRHEDAQQILEEIYIQLGLDPDDIYAPDEKTERIVLRSLVSQFENMADKVNQT